MELKLNKDELAEAILIHVFTKTGMRLTKEDVYISFAFKDQFNLPDVEIDINK